jgi:hypothetical protein
MITPSSAGGGGGGGEGEGGGGEGVAETKSHRPRSSPSPNRVRHRSMSPTTSSSSSTSSESDFEEKRSSKKSGSRRGKAKRPRAGSNSSAGIIQPTTRSTGDAVVVPISLKLNDDRWLWPEKHHSLLKAYHDHACPAEAALWASTNLVEPTTAELAQNLNTAAIPYITKPQAKTMLVAAGKWPVRGPDDLSTAPSSSSSSSSSSSFSLSSSSSSSSAPSYSSSSLLSLSSALVNGDPLLVWVPPASKSPGPAVPPLQPLRSVAHPHAAHQRVGSRSERPSYSTSSRA